MSNELEFLVEPYTAHKISFWTGWYEIMFEENTLIIRVRGEQTANRIAASLNRAYNLGRSFEIIRQTIRKENP